MSPRSYDESKAPLIGRLVEIATGEGRWRPGVIAFCETTLDGPKGAEVSTGRYRVAWGRFESKAQFLDVVAKNNTLEVRAFEARTRRALRHTPKTSPSTPHAGRVFRLPQIFHGTQITTIPRDATRVSR